MAIALLSSSSLQAGIKNLETDKTNGARVLATNAIKTLATVLAYDSKGLKSAQELWELMRFAGGALRDARPSMGAAIGAALMNALDALRLSWAMEIGPHWTELGGDQELGTLIDVGKTTLQDCIREREESVDRIGLAFAKLISELCPDSRQPISILTMSSSSTIKACLVFALRTVPNLRIHLKILESRPCFEGASFGLALLEAVKDGQTDGFLSVEIAPDCGVAMLARDVDVVLLGADRISSSGDVSNKIGSLPVAICAKTLSKTARVLVISETDKIARPGSMEEHKDEENEPEEVTYSWGDGMSGSSLLASIHVRNVYFEWIPSQWIDAYISEAGVIDRDAVEVLSQRIKELEDDLLGSIENTPWK